MTDHSAITSNWNYPTPTRFGPGRIKELAEACRELGIGKPLLVTDPGLAALPLVAETKAITDNAGLPTTLFTDVKANPVGKNVEDGVVAFLRSGCDGVISFGGGSALDVGKAVALLVGQERPLWDFEDVGDNYTRVIESGVAPHLAVPTTSGTGSEVGRSSVITDEAEQKKKVIFHPLMLPARVICDPALTVGLPPALTAGTGMDALSHNLEAYCTHSFHPLGDGIAVEGMRLVRKSLLAAFRDGGDLVARSEMMAASAMGATAFQKGLGAMHAVGHAVGALFDTHHGTTMATLMPYVLRLNRSEIEDKLARLAAYLGLPDPSFDAVQAWVLELREILGIPHTLAELGVSEDRVEEVAVRAEHDPTAPSNPVPLTKAKLTELIGQALRGDLG